MTDAATEAIKYAVSIDSGIEYLRCWLHGEFEACRNEWPDAPISCYIGSDPDMPATQADADFEVIATLVDVWSGSTFSAERDRQAFSKASIRVLGFELPAGWTGKSRTRTLGQDHWLECQVQKDGKIDYVSLHSYSEHEAALQMMYRLNRIHGKSSLYCGNY
ncbi:hypothetical protein D8I35_03110 [Corticibacter populi]|uniref:Uncharacterized protein n=1 Tax=Corticibacter populi TaxID=1550736 RepID=A0A3M6QZT7_9BURK|nr:hypothetical protein [Corticibacter populi]RMX08129.1 hypothetical protein D8I35_03110 [Corticibacter populi]RZS35381.1 hypothetical protein EV687_0445 [Corticibacter populi]